jgi:hypothetical protein
MHDQHLPPDFVIVGAAKCGTTALYEYFCQQPQIFMAKPKEPHYFADDLYSPHYITEESEYLQIFDAAPEGTIRGEASVHYINSNRAIDRLLRHNPDIKIIILLRNPVELVRSWHANLLYNGLEDIKNLEEAWRAQGVRAQGQRIPPQIAGMESRLQYRNMCAIGQQTARIVKQVPKEQLLILLLDDLERDHEAYHRRATGFLGVDYQPQASNTIVNPGKRSRSLRIARLISWGKFVNHPHVRALAPLFDRLGFHPLRMLRLANTSPHTHPEIRGEFQLELYESLKVEVDILESLLDRPLDSWRLQ